MIFLKSLILYTVLSFGYCATIKADPTLPTFSNAYTVKGTIFIPYAEIQEPFYAWYDLNSGSSRIDYYGGMVKTYQLSKCGPSGTLLKIAPVSTDSQMNIDTCLQVNGTDTMKVKPQTILPDTSGFKYIGDEMINGLLCEKWRLVEQVNEKVNKYTLWVRYKKSSKDPYVSVCIPVRYEMKGYNSLLGSHFDHYYLDYDWYTFDTPDPEVFAVPENMTCTSFPGPGSYHVYTFNPMKEFVHNYDVHVNEAFEHFKKKHNKEYINEKDHTQRKEVFRQNMRFIQSRNRASLGYQLAVNHLADRTNLELKALRGRRYSPGYNGGLPFPYITKAEKIPESIDWRLVGAVTPVKDQSVCGSCWSFGTTGTIEGAYFLKYGHQVRLSQQALIDCSWGYGNNGCDGGEDFRAYQWIMKHNGLPFEDEYGAYLGQDGYCHSDNMTGTAQITGYVNVSSGDVDALKVAVVKHGPISVAIDASHKSFTFYSNGIYYEPECKNKPDELDHAVLLVGYGTLNDQPFLLIKNSWSNYWGNDGYILMSPKDNNCGVATDPTYVLM